MRTSRREDGASAVEFALVVPLLLMLFFGIISFGIILAQNMALNNGAREGARYGVVDGKTCAQITATAKNASSSISMSPADVTVTIKRGQTAQLAANACANTSTKPCAGSAAGDSLYVETHFTSRTLVPMVILDDTVDIDGVGVFRCEFS